MKLLTDYFQSLELVSAGIPIETADYYYRKGRMYSYEEKHEEPPFPYIPCWSIAALWDLLHERDSVYEFATDLSSNGLVDELVKVLCAKNE